MSDKNVPPVGRPALRERCAKAIHRFDESIGEVPADWPEHWSELKSGVRKVYLLRADAVIAEMIPSREAIRAAIAVAGYEAKVATGWPVASDWEAVHGERYIDLDAAADAVLRVIAGGDE